MIVKIVKGDITDLPCGINVIIHQANVNKVMGAGVAKAIKEKFPFAAQADLNREEFWKSEGLKNPEDFLGYFSVGISPNLMIFNAYAQQLGKKSLAGHPTSYDAAYRSLSRINEFLRKTNHSNKIFKIGIPWQMGCGLGGGKWSIYRAIIEEVFVESPHQIIFVRF